MTQNIEKILKGIILVKELKDLDPDKRSWIEVGLHEEDLSTYPLRTPQYARTIGSPYVSGANSETSRFKVRIASFNAEEIHQGFDPSYDGVGEYEVITSLNALIKYLDGRGLSLDEFIESSVSDYPL